MVKSLESDVRKVGNHGSKTSSDESFIGITSPQYAVISAGKDNRYVHPHEEVIDILKQFEVETINTAESGRIVFTSDGRSVGIKK